jgi:hypothetical protein
MRRALVWRALDELRFEYSDVTVEDERLSARGVQLGVEQVPYRLTYELDTHPGFATRRLTVEAEGAGWERRLDLHGDGEGGWTVSGGDDASLAGAIDCDLGFSPLTNTLPVLRHRMLESDARPDDMLMAWVSVPGLAVTPAAQRYERLPGTAVRFRSLDGEFEGFTADLELDGDGFVVRYPELAERVP